MTTCSRCYERAAVNGTGLCRACAAALERIDRRARPDYYHAVSAAKRIDIYDIRQACWVWSHRPASLGARSDTEHVQVEARCVATLDGVRWFAGVIVAVERAPEQPGLTYRPRLAAYWVWLVKPPEDLIVPVLRFERGRVEIVRLERESAKESEVSYAE